MQKNADAGGVKKLILCLTQPNSKATHCLVSDLGYKADITIENHSVLCIGMEIQNVLSFKDLAIYYPILIGIIRKEHHSCFYLQIVSTSSES